MRIDDSEIINPGLLRHQFHWQRRTVTGQDSFGQDIVAWPTLVTIYGQLTALAGRELESVRQLWAEARYKIVQPHYAGLRRADRIEVLIDGEVKHFDVLDIQTSPGSGAYQTIYAKELTK